jgi:hypothetical protein
VALEEQGGAARGMMGAVHANCTTGSNGCEIGMGERLVRGDRKLGRVVGNGNGSFVVATEGAAESEKARRGARRMCCVRGVHGRLMA